MATSSRIRVQCPNCGTIARCSEADLSLYIECPRCNELVRFTPIATPKDDGQSSSTRSPLRSRFDKHHQTSVWIASGGLLLLALSPFFLWVKIGTGGVTGLAGDGKIVLAITVIMAGAFAAAIVTRRWLVPIVLAVQGWGTIALFWMGSLVWKLSSFLDSMGDSEPVPFGSLFTALVAPGTGLYLGLIGGITVVGSLGFLAVRLLLVMDNLKLFYAGQSIGCALGILVAFVVGPDYTSINENENLAISGRPQEAWKRTHRVSDDQWDGMIANFRARRYPESVSAQHWWEEAKDKTPAQLNKLYPPLKPREWYRANWINGYSGSRELDRNINLRGPDTYRLYLKLWIRTEPELPTKALHGNMAFIMDGKIIYEVSVFEKPDVSFTDKCPVWLKIDPYDDNNHIHRTLRYAKDDKLTPVFTIEKVVLADGTEKIFEGRDDDPTPPEQITQNDGKLTSKQADRNSDTQEREERENLANSLTSPAIPGIVAVDVHGNLTNKGFKLAGPERIGDQEDWHVQWTCTDKASSHTLTVEIFGNSVNDVYRIRATCANYGNRSTTELAKDFLSYVATLPYKGAMPSRATQWVKSNIDRNAKMQIGHVLFEIVGARAAKSRVLLLTGQENSAHTSNDDTEKKSPREKVDEKIAKMKQTEKAQKKVSAKKKTQEERARETWKRESREFTVEGEPVRAIVKSAFGSRRERTVILTLEDGSTIRTNSENISEEDRDFVDKWMAQKLEKAKKR